MITSKNKVIKILMNLIISMIVIKSFYANEVFANNQNLTLQQYQPQKLKLTVKLNEPIIKLGDVFENVPKIFDIALFRAPPPGKQVWLNTEQLQQEMSKNNINWQKPAFPNKILVKRNGYILNENLVEDIIIKKILEQQFITNQQAKNIKLKLTKMPRNLYLSKSEQKPLDILEIRFNQKQNIIKAIITIRDYDENEDFIIEAKVKRVFQIPVLKHRAKKEQKISRDMLEYKEFIYNYNQENILAKFLIDIENIVGLVAKNIIPKGKPILTQYLEKSNQVNENDMITVSYYQDGLSIKMKAKALQKGFTGDIIQIRNIQSNKNLEARIVKKGIVEVLE